MNAAEAQFVRDQLFISDERYRHLVEEHHQLDRRLHELASHPYPSDSEQLEEVTLKKRKLALKDRIEYMTRLHAELHPAAEH
jgi:uncharacterized protein YdcH (DUF465 family)